MPDESNHDDRSLWSEVGKLQFASAMAQQGMEGLLAEPWVIPALFGGDRAEHEKDHAEALAAWSTRMAEERDHLFRRQRLISTADELAEICHACISQLEHVDRWRRNEAFRILTAEGKPRNDNRLLPGDDYSPRGLVTEVYSVLWRLVVDAERAKPTDPGAVKSIPDAIAALKAVVAWHNCSEMGDGEDVAFCVTLYQMAAIVSRSKSTLERFKKNLPPPKVKGGNGRPDEWDWTEVRPVLEERYRRELPARFPADRFIPR